MIFTQVITTQESICLLFTLTTFIEMGILLGLSFANNELEELKQKLRNQI